MSKKINIIFLNIDGVLNNENTEKRTPRGFIGIEDTMLFRLKEIIEAIKGKIVLASEWRYFYNFDKTTDIDGQYLINKLKEKGLSIYDKTTEDGYDKGQQVKQWLEEHKEEVKKYIIIDTENEKEYKKAGLIENTIIVKEDIGLNQKIVEKVVKIVKESKI